MNNAPQSPSSSSARVEHARLQQLEQKYTALDAQIAESPVLVGGSILIEPTLDELDWALNEAGLF